jgi:hypothetical protein
MTACGASPVSEAAARDRGRDVDRTHRRSPSDSRSTVALSRDRAAGLPEAVQKIRQRMSGRRCHRLRLSRWIDYDISRDHSTDKFMSWWMRATT